MQSIEKQLRALANGRRLAIVHFLNKAGKETVGNIAKEIRLSFRSTSKHLAVLRAADMVSHEQVGLQHYYSLSHPLLRVLKIILTEV